MKLMEYLQSRPTFFLAIVIIIICICIIGMVIFILFKLEDEKKVTKTALELNKITNSIKAGLVNFIYEDNYRITYASKGFFELLGYSREELQERNKLSLLDFVDDRDQSTLLELEKQLNSNCIYIEIRMMTKTGQVMHILMNGNSAQGRDSKHTISAVLIDITDQKMMQEMILLEGERYRVAAELSNDVLFEYHISSDEMVYTDKYRDQFGRKPIMPTFCHNCNDRRETIHPDDWGIYLEFCSELSEGKKLIEAEFRMKDKLNEFIWCQTMGKTIYDDEKKPLRVIGKIVNIDTQKRELEAMEYKATRDPLTGVYNKEVTLKKIEKFINGNKNGKHILMIIDFDDFKKVNDNYGHLLGDKALIHVIGRIKGVFSEGEIIGRIGGDEFVVFAGGIDDMEDIRKKAENLIAALDTVYLDNGLAIPISGSIGIASYPEDGMHYEQLVGCADKALYQVKRQGKNNYMLYNSAI